MQLKPLLEGIVEFDSSLNVEISGLALDSREVQGGELFFALPGGQDNGSKYIAAAIERGAVAVLVEQSLYENAVKKDAAKTDEHGVPVFAAVGLKNKVGEISARYYARPTRDLQLIGVTGTNGKTSCTYLLAQALDLLGQKSVLMGTLGYGYWNQLQSTKHTTPDAISVQKYFAEMKNENIRFGIMEVSSHALDQGRVGGCEFDIALFTNLSHEHLDYHQNFEQYRDTKKQLFLRPELQTIFLNSDDPVGRQWLGEIVDANKSARCQTFGHQVDADFSILDEQLSRAGIAVKIDTPQGICDLRNENLYGEFNISNLVAVTAMLVGLGFSNAQIEAVVPGLQGVPGRLQKLPGTGPLVFVDYAHTPDALEKVLRSCGQLKSGTGKLICLFGCGGERDKGKRPIMGRIAEDFADEIIITADNSRNEETLTIIAEIMTGIKNKAAINVIEERAQAIGWAINSAAAEDVVVIAGKGAETYQILKQGVTEFSDFDHAAEALRLRGLH